MITVKCPFLKNVITVKNTLHRTSSGSVFSVNLFFILSPLCVESMRDAVGRKVKLSLRKRVKLEIKGDKTENRVLVSRLLLLLSYFFIKGSKIFLFFSSS